MSTSFDEKTFREEVAHMNKGRKVWHLLQSPKNLSNITIAKLVKCHPSYVSQLRHGHILVSPSHGLKSNEDVFWIEAKAKRMEMGPKELIALLITVAREREEGIAPLI